MITQNWIVPKEISEFLIEETFNAEEVVNTIKDKYRSISKGVLWNVTVGSISNITIDDMQQIATAVKNYASHDKTAFLGSLDLDFGLLRMYEAYAEMENIAHMMKVFRDRDEAIKWLMEPKA